MIVVADRFRKSEGMRRALISTFINLCCAAREANRYGDRFAARRYGAAARELAAVFGKQVRL